jgi:hypothetical protein
MSTLIPHDRPHPPETDPQAEAEERLWQHYCRVAKGLDVGELLQLGVDRGLELAEGRLGQQDDLLHGLGLRCGKPPASAARGGVGQAVRRAAQPPALVPLRSITLL